MSSKLRELLESATGESQDIIAVVLDIRGFTPFCVDVGESMNIATFIRRVYIEIIDKYFANASFHKPTGDGLLTVIPYTPETLKEVLCNTIKDCLDINQNFKRLFEKDLMINFDTPERIGIGVTRGVVCCISSKGTILDYSGKVINLASRLNDFARPSGIVFDRGFGLHLLPKEIQKLFLSDSIYIKGVAEQKPIVVHYTKEYTIIPTSAKQPIAEPKWFRQRRVANLKNISKIYSEGVGQSITLNKKPLDEKQITLEISFRRKEGIQHTFLDTSSSELKYEARGNKYLLVLALRWLIDDLKKFGAAEDTEITYDVCYSVTDK